MNSMWSPIGGGDIYGDQADDILGYEDISVAIAASGGDELRADVQGGNGSMAWLAFIGLLVAARVIYEFAD